VPPSPNESKLKTLLTIQATCANLSLCIPGLERDAVRLRVRRPPSPVRPTADPRAEPSRAALRRDGPGCSAARRLRQTRQRQPVRTCHQLTGSFYVFTLGIILYSFYVFIIGIILYLFYYFHFRYHFIILLGIIRSGIIKKHFFYA
jgi:hypothetical protein